MNTLHEELKRHFGFDTFRPGQEEIIRTLLAGRDVLGVLATGAGKSLCYQLPALLLPGVTLVVSPLIALMQDQVEQMRRRGLDCATFLNSALPREELQERMAGIAEGRYKLVYLAPERIRSREFRRLLERVEVSQLVVDEAHCISEWGHDFRTDYLLLGALRQQLGQVPVMALTATATKEVQDDIVLQLGIEKAVRIILGYDRPNLAFFFCRVRSMREKYRAALQFLCGRRGSGIVYVATRGECEEAARFLQEQLGEAVGYYHAGMEAEERHRIQRAFTRGEIRLVAATNAFGMGIDKPDIRFVLHLYVPSSVESYYQEAGRAGRDGQPSVCLTLYTEADRGIHHFFVKKEIPEEKEADRLAHWLNRLSAAACEDGRMAPTEEKGTALRLRWRELTSLQGFTEEKVSLLFHLWEQAGAVLLDESDPHEVVLRWNGQRYALVRKEIALHLKRLRRRRYDKLNAMVELLRGEGCRRETILRYFGEERFFRPRPCCDHCDADLLPRLFAKAGGQSAGDAEDATASAIAAALHGSQEIAASREITAGTAAPSLVTKMPRLARTEAEEAHALGEAKDPAGLPRLYQLLQSPSVTTRRMAVSAIGKIGRKEAVPYLLPLLRDANPQVRQYTLKALHKIGDPQARPHVEELLRREEKEYNRREALSMLQEWDG